MSAAVTFAVVLPALLVARFTRHPMPGPCDRYPVGSTQHTGGAS